jgi:hypothetical protein
MAIKTFVIKTNTGEMVRQEFLRDGIFGVVKLDYDQLWPETGMVNVSRRTRDNAPRIEDGNIPHREGLPATARFMVDKVVIMTPDIQLWMHKLCWDRCPSLSEKEAKNSWRSIMTGYRFITNYAGSGTHADYVNGTNLESDPMQLQPMATGGAIVKITGNKYLQGVDCFEFEAIDSLGNYRSYNPDSYPYLFFQPTSSVREEILKNGRWLGKWRENLSLPFPQYREQSVIPIFAVGTNRAYLPKWRIRILGSNEAFPSPFVK